MKYDLSLCHLKKKKKKVFVFPEQPGIFVDTLHLSLGLFPFLFFCFVGGKMYLGIIIQKIM